MEDHLPRTGALLAAQQAGRVCFIDDGVVDTAIEEAEAESVAFLCCATLGLPGLEEARGYVQAWLGSSAKAEEFAKKSAARVFSAAVPGARELTVSGKRA